MKFSAYRRLAALMMGVLLLCLALCSAAAEGATENRTSGFTQVEGKYGAGYTQQMIYSDSFLLEDSTQGAWPEVVKIAATLAGAADEEELINSMLAQIGYNSESFNFDKKRTLEDNDIVSYTIGTKKLQDTDKTAFIVAIRGTGESAEWFSTFNVGNGTDHAGFTAALKDVKTSLTDYIRNTAVSDRIILVTGHGRGGAVANLLSFYLCYNDLVLPEQLFGYTFGCPNVTKNPREYPSIYNFNLVGDMLTVFPPSDWGFKRHGRDIDITAQGDMFKALTGREYNGAKRSDHYETAIRNLFPKQEDLDDDSNTGARFFVMYLAYSLGGHMDVTLNELMGKYMEENLGTIVKKLIFEDTLPEQLEKIFESTAKYYTGIQDLVLEIQRDTEGMTDEEFEDYRERRKDAIVEIYEATGILISTVEDIHPVIAFLADAIQYADEAAALYNFFFAQVETTDGHLLTSILDAHQIPIYVFWVNHEYYGYRGHQLSEGEIELPEGVYTIGPECFSNSKITSFCAEELRLIPDNCFEYAASLETLVIPDSIEKIGPAFEGCSGLTNITLPIEQSGFNIFYGCSNVENIHYTVQDDGVMPERSGYSSDGNYYASTLEFICRQNVRKIVYDEGIEEIPNYANYHNGQGKLELVTLPSTLKRIGHYAFYGCAMRTIELPESLETIGDSAFARNPLLGFIHIPENVVNQGSYSFGGCVSLESLTFGCRVIGPRWFEDCTGLEILLIPSNIVAINPAAFRNCTGLKYVMLPIEQSGFGAFDGCTNVQVIEYTAQNTGVMPLRDWSSNYDNYYGKTLEYQCRDSVKKLIYNEGVTEIAALANYHNGTSQLAEVSLPSTLKKIGGYAFYGTAIPGLTLPDALEEIGEYAFAGSGKLASIQIPASVTKQGSYAFAWCGALKNITFGSSIIGPRWFEGCTGLETLVIPNNVTSIHAGAFRNCTGLKSVKLPIEQSISGVFSETSNVETIEYTAQSNGVMPARDWSSNHDNYYGSTLEYVSRANIKKLIYNEGVTEIANLANYHNGTSQLAEVSLPSTLKKIGGYAFYGTAVPGLTLPEALEEIGEYAFAGSGKLASIQIPASVTKQGGYAFAWCGALKNITFDSSIIGPRWFEGCTGLETLVIPNNVTSIHAGAFRSCTGLKSVKMPIEQSGFSIFSETSNVETIEYTAQSNGVMPARDWSSNYDNDYGSTLEYVSRANIKKLIYNEGVTEIANLANYHNGTSQLAEVSLPSTLKKIGGYAFYGTAVPGLTLPDALEEIGEYAFAGSGKLASIQIPASVTKQGGYAFAWCGALKNITFDSSIIGPNWFDSCTGLETLVIPNNVTSIHAGAFRSCTGLKSVTMPIEQSISGVFTETCHVETIEYTVQSNGVMPARDWSSNYDNDYGSTLEFVSRASIKKLIYNEGVTEIANLANYHNGVSQLAEVILPSTLKKIGGYAFYGTAVPGLTLPEALEEIGEYAFAGSGKLASIQIPASVTKQGGYAFAWCGALKNITFDSSIIGPNWFDSCTGLETLVIPNNVTSIHAGAFRSCTGLKSVTMPIEQSISGVFTETSNVETIEYTVQSNGVMPARDWSSNHDYYYGSTLEYVSRANIKKLIYNEGVTEIANLANYHNGVSQLAEVILPSTLKKIGGYAFYGTALPSITLPENLETIDSYAFAYGGLRQAALGEKVSYIGYDAFTHPSLLVICPENSYVHTWASDKGFAVLHCCAAPVPVALEASLPTCTASGWSEGLGCSRCGKPLTRTEIPASGHALVLTQTLYETAQNERIEILFDLTCGGMCGDPVHWADGADGTEMAASDGSAVYASAQPGARTLLFWLGDAKDEAVSCTAIVHASAQLVLPGSLSELACEALCGSAAQECILPDGMAAIGPRAFADCENLVLITIPDTVEQIADDAFAGVSGLAILCGEGSYAQQYAARMEIPWVGR